MSNLRICAVNLVSYFQNLSASSESGDLIAANLYSTDRSLLWRASGTTATLSMLTVGASNWNVASLAFTNLESSATMRAQGNSGDSGTVALSDVGVLYGSATSAALREHYFGTNNDRYATVFLPTPAVQTMNITLNNSNGAAIEAGYLFVGEYWEPQYNADYGMTFSFEDASQRERSVAGALKIDKRTIYRKLTFTLSNMATADRNSLLRILRIAGTSNPVFIAIFPDSADVHERQAFQMIGYVKNAPGIIAQGYNRNQATVEIEEI